MSDAVKLILSLSVSGGALALLLLALKRAFRNRLPKAFQYYVWLVVLLRLALPVSFGFSVTDSLFRAIPGLSGGANASAALKTPYTETYRPNPPISVQPGEEFSFNEATRARESAFSSLQAVDYLLLIWIAGAAIALLIKISGYARFAMKLKKAHRSARPGEEQLLKRLHSGIAIKRNPLARTPMLMGFIRPVIVLPDRTYTDEELLFILEHELTHYRRLDIPLKWLSLLIICAHWFNPLAYFIQREMDRACELSCDEAVIKALDAKGKQAYGETLISAVAPERFIGALTTMCQDKATLKERLAAIMDYRHKSKAIKALSAALLLLVAAAAGVLGACVAPEPVTEATIENSTSFKVTVQPTPRSAVPFTVTVPSASDSDAPAKATVQPAPESVVPYTTEVTVTGSNTHVIDEKIYVTNDSGSDDVRALQTRLNELAASHPSIPKVEVNGAYDEATKAAVIEAQREFGLETDGLVGPDTWFALAPFDGAAVFAKKSGEILAITHSNPRFEGSQAEAAAELERGAWIVVAPQGGSAGEAEAR